jgi:chromosomal replication initiation ATPase DnaA
VSIEIDLKQAVVKLSNPTEEIRMFGEQGQQMRITKCRQDRQGRVFITVEIENRRKTKTSRKKSVKRKSTKRKVTKSRTHSRSTTTKRKKTGFNKLLGEIL